MMALEVKKMSQLKNRYKAKLDGKTYTIIGAESKVHMDIVTELANIQLREIREIAPETSTENASILLAINALSDQLKKEKQLMKIEGELSQLKKEMKALTEEQAVTSDEKTEEVAVESEKKANDTDTTEEAIAKESDTVSEDIVESK